MLNVQQTEKKNIRLDSQWTDLLRRLLALGHGQRYMVTLTVGEKLDWSVIELGRVEKHSEGKL